MSHHDIDDIDDVMTGLKAAAEAMLEKWIADRRAEAWPEHAIAALAAAIREQQAKELQRARPLIERDLQITAGAASLH